MKKLFQYHRLITNQFGSANLVPFKWIGKNWRNWKRLQKILSKQWRQRKQGNQTFVISYLIFWPAFIWHFFLQKAALRSNGYEMNLPRAWAEKIRLLARQLRKQQIWDNYKSLFTEKKKRKQVIHPMRSRGLWWCS